MGELEWRAGRWVDQMRRTGSVVVGVGALGVSVETWRVAIREASRQAGLRVRTGLSDDRSTVWAYHVDHQLTETEKAASLRAITSALQEDATTYAEHLEQERRKRIRAVPDNGQME